MPSAFRSSYDLFRSNPAGVVAQDPSDPRSYAAEVAKAEAVPAGVLMSAREVCLATHGAAHLRDLSALSVEMERQRGMGR